MMGSHETECAHCGGTLVESPYPRHTIILQDESEAAENRRIERRLCPTCWDEEFDTLAEKADDAQPSSSLTDISTTERESVPQDD